MRFVQYFYFFSSLDFVFSFSKWKIYFVTKYDSSVHLSTLYKLSIENDPYNLFISSFYILIVSWSQFQCHYLKLFGLDQNLTNLLIHYIRCSSYVKTRCPDLHMSSLTVWSEPFDTRSFRFLTSSRRNVLVLKFIDTQSRRLSSF